MFFFGFCKIFKNIFWQDTSGWLLLVFICQFWEVVQMTFFLESAKLISSTSYRTVPHPDVFWYRLNGMGAKRNVFPCMFHVKPKWNIVYIYLKNKNFSRDSNILPQMHWTSDIFGHSATIIGGFGVSLNYPILNLKKTVCPKNVWMRHCRKKVFHKRFSSILYKNKKQLFEG